jgi:hypothetical protein
MVSKMGKITEERILEILAPMYEVMPKVEKSGMVALFKEGVKFGMIKGETVHLVDKYGDFEKVADDVMLDADQLLQAATRAFWIACGKITG